MKDELAVKSIEQLAPLLAKKELSPVELTKAVLARIEDLDHQIGAFIQYNPDRALDAAIAAESEIVNGRYRGPLHGIPMALKDIFYRKGQITTFGSRIHRDFKPAYDATVVERLTDAGAIFTGTLNMHEYAWGGTTDNPHYGTCRNPWDLERSPGGSSGGAGAAVAADLAVASLGTDTGGSIRIPSAFCGIVGLKPTHGRVSKYGVFPLAWSLDHVGPMTKTVRDAAILLEAIAGYDSSDPTSVDVPVVPYTDYLNGELTDLVIGFEEEYFFKCCDDEVAAVVRQALAWFESMGATVKPVSIPSLRHAPFAELVTITSEASAIHHRNLKERPNDFGEDVRLLLELGELNSAVDYLQAQQVRHKLKRDFTALFREVDVLVSPTLPIPAPRIGQDTVEIGGLKLDIISGLTRFMAPGNLTGLPALTVPCGFVSGMPVGLQLIGPAFREEVLLNLGYAFEQTQPLQGRRPSVSVRANAL